VAWLLVAVAFLAGCNFSRTQTIPVPTPEDGVKLVIDSFRKGEPAVALRMADARAASPPDTLLGVFQKITGEGSAKSYKVIESKQRGDSVDLRVATYSDDAHERKITTSVWTFSTNPSGWILTKLVVLTD
jgi:hypothetical protein